MKRWFDLILTLGSLPLWLPLLGLVALLVRVRLGSPVWFTQERIGRHGRSFRLVKFRSMREADLDKSLPDAERLTGFGCWLRATSLDELPELWHVLTGEMSLVGPRPLLPQYLPRYTTRQACRHDVRPGLTGWAQVNGRNAVDWSTRLAMDVWYVENRSLWLDLRVIALTFGCVLRCDGVAAAGEVTMPEFTGAPDQEWSPG